MGGEGGERWGCDDASHSTTTAQPLHSLHTYVAWLNPMTHYYIASLHSHPMGWAPPAQSTT